MVNMADITFVHNKDILIDCFPRWVPKDVILIIIQFKDEMEFSERYKFVQMEFNWDRGRFLKKKALIHLREHAEEYGYNLCDGWFWNLIWSQGAKFLEEYEIINWHPTDNIFYSNFHSYRDRIIISYEFIPETKDVYAMKLLIRKGLVTITSGSYMKNMELLSKRYAFNLDEEWEKYCKKQTKYYGTENWTIYDFNKFQPF